MAALKQDNGALRIGELACAEDLSARWGRDDLLLLPEAEHPEYMLGFAASPEAVEAAQRLRYEVFNLELGEGLTTSAIHGVDRDAFDEQMTHLLVVERATGEIAGTYRLQTVEHALAHLGLYAAQEYALEPMLAYADCSAECGRACLAPTHRCMAALHLLWQGIATFMRLHRKRFLFGCCSLTTTEPMDGWRAMRTIRESGYLHPDLFVRAQAEYDCGPEPAPNSPAMRDPLRLPKLFRTYMRLGSRVTSGPAIDRDFGTVDFLVMQDTHDIALSRFNTAAP